MDDRFLEVKGLIDEDFLPNTWTIFNLLGEVDFPSEYPLMVQDEREVRQYITVESMRKNLWKVFGVHNDFFAYMLFTYLTADGPRTKKVSYLQFLQRFMPIWPKKGAEKLSDDPREKEKFEQQQALQTKIEMFRFVYDLHRITGSDYITLVDLM
jgi:hypothetical protein